MNWPFGLFQGKRKTFLIVFRRRFDFSIEEATRRTCAICDGPEASYGDGLDGDAFKIVMAEGKCQLLVTFVGTKDNSERLRRDGLVAFMANEMPDLV